MQVKVKMLLFLLLISIATHGQTVINAYKKCIRNNIRYSGNNFTYKPYWKGLEEIFLAYKKISGYDLNTADTLYVVFAAHDFYANFFSEARIWNKRIDLSATSDLSDKKQEWNVFPTTRDASTNASVLPEVDLIKHWVITRDTTAIKSKAKCMPLGGYGYQSFIFEKHENWYSTLVFEFDDLCLKQRDIRWKLELQD